MSSTKVTYDMITPTPSSATDLSSHASNTSNPHGVTKAQVGLGNVDNTSDATKNSAVATLTNKTLTAPVINSPTGIVKGDVGLGNVTNDAQLKRADGDINSFTAKTSAADADIILIEDSAASYAKKKITKANLIGTAFTNPMDAIGQIIYGGASGTPTKLAAGTSGYFLKSNGAADPSWANAPFSECMIIKDEKAAGTNGGGAAAGSQTRDLNTVHYNTITGASLASNQITLPAGTFDIEASAPAFAVGRHKIFLKNVTDATNTIIGTAEYAAGVNNTNRSFITGRFTIASSKVFEIIHYCESAVATNGLGVNGGAIAEVFTTVKIVKVG